MRATVLPRSRQLSEAAERQMRIWALHMESQQRLSEQATAAPPRQLIHPFIAISREAGVDAGAIAQAIAARLGWKVFDRELLDYMAEHYHWSRIALEYVDERTASWFHETFGKWLDQQQVSQAEFVSSLSKIVLMAAQHENVVFVGRGVQFILPREKSLAVRLVAPRAQRLQRVMSRRQCSQNEAENFVDETDRGRADFVRRYFHREVADPHFHDLVINLRNVSRDTAIKLIVDAHELASVAASV